MMDLFFNKETGVAVTILSLIGIIAGYIKYGEVFFELYRKYFKKKPQADKQSFEWQAVEESAGYFGFRFWIKLIGNGKAIIRNVVYENEEGNLVLLELAEPLELDSAIKSTGHIKITYKSNEEYMKAIWIKCSNHLYLIDGHSQSHEMSYEEVQRLHKMELPPTAMWMR